MSQIDEIVAKAEAATEAAHAAVARLDRVVFRKQIIADPTPEVWFAHHTTNEAFKALVRSRQACTGAVEASLAGNEAMFNKLCKECEAEADLAIYLAMIVEERLSLKLAQS
jgi:microcompartment protein CcmL/EutN